MALADQIIAWLESQNIQSRDFQTGYDEGQPERILSWGADLGSQPTADQMQAAYAAKQAVQFQKDVVAAVQNRLDAFAKTRNYDSILSASTYATSVVQKFRTEGQYCVDLRDQTWAALYQLMADVQAGNKPMPASVADVLALLPTPAWPA